MKSIIEGAEFSGTKINAAQVKELIARVNNLVSSAHTAVKTASASR